MKMNDEQVASLAGFALDILNEWPDISMMDGGDLQEIAEKHKLLVPQIVHAPCSDEGCACAEVCSDSEFARGVTCYRIVDWLVRDAQLRIGADDAGQNVDTQAIYHECGNCGVPRFVHGVILEACPNCGDDETDLSLIDEVP